MLSFNYIIGRASEVSSGLDLGPCNSVSSLLMNSFIRRRYGMWSLMEFDFGN